MEGRAQGLWVTQDALQPLHPVEPAWRLRPHLRGSRGRRPKAQTHHDRLDASESASHGGQPFKKGAVPRRIGRTKGGLNSKLTVVCDGAGKPLVMLLTEGQMSGRKGARLMHDTLPGASTLITDRGYDSNWFRQAFEAKGIAPGIPPAKSRKTPLDYDKSLYRHRHKIENLSAKLKDGRRIASSYDRCAHTFFSAIYIAAAVVLYLNQ